MVAVSVHLLLLLLLLPLLLSLLPLLPLVLALSGSFCLVGTVQSGQNEQNEILT